MLGVASHQPNTMSDGEGNKTGEERVDLFRDEETNKEIYLRHPETLADGERQPVREAGKEPKPEMDVSDGAELEDSLEAMDEDAKEKSDDELKGGSMEDQNANQVSGTFLDGEDSGGEDEQAAFMLELERFHKDHNLEYKPPKFYGTELNCLKLWRQVIKLGGYEIVTSCKLWRQVGESFRPPKTCTTVSWSFRIFYEKSLLEYERHKIRLGELQIAESSIPEITPIDHQIGIGKETVGGGGGGGGGGGSSRVRRDAAQRAMEGWHSQRLLGNNADDSIKKDKHFKNIGSISNNNKKKKTANIEKALRTDRTRVVKSESESMVIDVGPPADWVKINVRQTKDCYEVYALVPGLLREEVHVQSDPAGRLVISGQPERIDNPWGVTPFKKVISLPTRIDPHQTSAVVTLHGQLFVRVPFETSNA